MCELNDHTDAEFERRRHLYELDHPSDDDQRWLQWCRDAERLIGVKSLDGDEEVDGYSLDYAHEEFKAGTTPVTYANNVARKMLALGKL